MPKLRVLSFHQDNTKKRPNDDFYAYLEREQVFAVADGVSRTWKHGDPEELRSAKPAAASFCEELTRRLAEKKPVTEAFARANAAVKQVNLCVGITSQTVDYLVRDYLCCVGVGVKLEGNRLWYGCLGDSRVMVCGSDLSIKWMSLDTVEKPEKFRDQRVLDWDLNEREKWQLWRETLRNPSRRWEMTYGALTGEEQALEYLETGSIELACGDVVLLFSDGVTPFISDPRSSFLAQIRDLLQDRADRDVCEARIKEYLKAATESLALQKVENLNDDRTFIALSLV
ncbi:MAG: hypothetical protein A3J58_02540 [Candidatus Sungbacteria bacterium RIFCSPHIGHO2_02_FULL_52_23]|uniref:PPM-type phosphatase domain-containing protein n=1 Tax=Candidatus Sungbacteria bacterium RIFCSPHIGHO2_02_FULL_52_23 TaxID=1802274 RepID=A0A1G2L020_9BACT|nr:MAG: hypothetical protein A3J58_02540 [Candidatus Sungbacteria bacterium RIFCSPHIGHO2_02_FULL_52_23]